MMKTLTKPCLFCFCQIDTDRVTSYIRKFRELPSKYHCHSIIKQLNISSGNVDLTRNIIWMDEILPLTNTS